MQKIRDIRMNGIRRMRRALRNSSIAAGLLLAALPGCFPSQRGSLPRPVPQPGAEAYYRWLLDCIAGVEEDLPHIAASADVAARIYVDHEDAAISSIGDPGLQSEALGRSGGMMQFLRPQPGSILLLAPREDHFEEDVAAAMDWRRKDCHVIIIARRSIISAAKRLGGKFDAQIENHAAEHGGTFIIQQPSEALAEACDDLGLSQWLKQWSQS